MVFEASLNGAEWHGLPVTPIGGGTAVFNTSTPGLFIASVAGLALVRARLTGTVTGGVTVVGLGTTASL